jgi:hypothetical protein
MHQRVGQSRARTWKRAPSVLLVVVLAPLLAVRHFNQALARLRAPVQHHVFNRLRVGLGVVVHADHASVDDAHVHTGLNRVVHTCEIRFAHWSLPRKLKDTLTRRPDTLAPGNSLIQRVASKSTA